MQVNMEVNIANKNDTEKLVGFLTEPQIDQSFQKPLSMRSISIRDRVQQVFSNGHWVYAQEENSVLVCLGVVPDDDKESVSLSTLGVRRHGRSLLAARLVYETSIWSAKKAYHAKKVCLDSWAGNNRLGSELKRCGFEVTETYDDPVKRPDGLKSVVYEMAI